MIKIVFFDVDNTLIPHTNYELSSLTIEAIKKLQEKDIKVVICTGRSECELKKMNLLNQIDWDGLICMCGQYIKVNQEVIYKNYFSKELMNHFIYLKNKYNLDCLFYTVEDIYSSSPLATESYRSGNGHFIVPNYDLSELLNKECYSFSMYCESDTFKKLSIEKYDVRLIDYPTKEYEVFPLYGGKGNAIVEVLKYYHFDKNESMSFGDSINDLDMFEYTEISIAMDNASQSVKEKVTYVTDSVVNEGIYKALCHYRLID